MISIEGNIGAGKSFLCDLLKKNGITVSKEPIMDWKFGHIDVLDEFYKNPKKYACMFQTLVLRTRVEQVRNIEEGVIERSVASDIIFGSIQYKLGNMDDVEFSVYSYQYKQAVIDTPTILGYIYVKTPTQTCMNRISKRQRIGEGDIPEWYLNELGEAHDTWLNKLDNVLVLDGSKDWTDPVTVKNILLDVKTFISLHIHRNI
jgi:deoxycitidine kinase/deoxyguanosine kinase